MVEKGSIVRVEYEAWTEDGDLFDTTVKDVAKKANAHREDIVYEPLPLVVGAGRVLPGFDAALEEANVGEEREVEIPPEQGFGPRDSAKVETHSLREFLKREIEPHPGMRVQFENRTGTVMSVTPGRVRVDFNHPFAGKTIRYKFTIKEKVDDPESRIRALIEQSYGQGRAADFGIEVAGETAILTLPDSCKYDQRWFVAKYRLVSDTRAYTGVKNIHFVERYDYDDSKKGDAAPAAPHSHEHDHEHDHDHDHAHDHEHHHHDHEHEHGHEHHGHTH